MAAGFLIVVTLGAKKPSVIEALNQKKISAYNIKKLNQSIRCLSILRCHNLYDDGRLKRVVRR